MLTYVTIGTGYNITEAFKFLLFRAEKIALIFSGRRKAEKYHSFSKGKQSIYVNRSLTKDKYHVCLGLKLQKVL